ncbi:hypothetical protein [Alkaliphilus crotonatoxidans]
MKMNQLMIERLIPFIYQRYDGKLLKELERNFLEKNSQLQHQFQDWLVFDYRPEKSKSFVKLFLEEQSDQLNRDEINGLQRADNSYLGLYEVTKMSDQEVHIKNLFTEDRHSIPKENLVESPEGNELMLIRVGEMGTDEVFSSSIILLPYQFKTMLVGQIIEAYDRAKARHPYLSYQEYFKKYPLELLDIINRLLSYENQEGDCTLYQGTYIVLNPKQFNEAITSMAYLQPEEDHVYLLKEGQYTLATLVYENNRLEVECTSPEDLELAKERLTEKLGKFLHHVKDEELTIDDII